MNHKDKINQIEEKISEIHQAHFYSGKKKKEKHNFFVGVLLGIGLSLMVGAGLDFFVGNSHWTLYNNILHDNNLTLRELPFSEQVSYLSLFSSNLHLLLAAAFGFFLAVIALVYFLAVNKDILDHRVKYSFKLKKDYSLSDLGKEIEMVFKKVKEENRTFANIRYKINHDLVGNRLNISFYKWYNLFMEYPNRMWISSQEIKVLYQTSKLGESFGKFIDELLSEMTRKKIFIQLKKEKRA